jgi:hypothetical protein
VRCGRYVSAGTAVERGSIDHDAFGVGIDVHACIDQAEASELRWWGRVGKERAVVCYCLCRDRGLCVDWHWKEPSDDEDGGDGS